MNIDNYAIFDWKGDTYIEPLTRAKAKKFYSAFMEGKENRVNELQKVLEIVVKLDHSLSSLDYIEYWLCEEITKQNISKDYPIEDERTPEFKWGNAVPALWRSIANDIGIYMAEMWMIRFPDLLHWEMMSSSPKLFGSNYPGVKGFPHGHHKFICPVVYDVYNIIYDIIEGTHKCHERVLIRQYSGNVPELYAKGLGGLPPIPDDLLDKIKLHPEL